ncbi:MAG: DUF2800 domain-containing protein [Pseudomonadota bacterium]|nr:DUF2800 domain-containing protein [Pseudomonadota bacterium]
MQEIDLLNIVSKTPDHSERAHSPLGASACARWWNCPGSIYLSRGVPSRSSIFAKEGTAAHELAQKCLENDEDADKYINIRIDDVLVTEEMAEAVQEYIDVCRGEAELGTRGPMIETRISLARLNPPADMFGTADFMVVQGSTLTVVDLKYGQGVRVSAVGNPQLKYYALGALYALPDDIGIRKIRVGIVQPRALGYQAPDWVEYDILELLEWSVELIERAEIAMQPTAEVNPGTWCKFCPASGLCPAQADKALRAAQDLFSVEEASVSEVALPAIAALTPVELSSLLDNAKLIEAWIAAARSAATALLTVDPESVPGYEMGPKRGTREWVGNDSAHEMLIGYGLTEDEIYTKEIISPPKAEDILSRKLKAEKKVKTLKDGKARIKQELKPFNHTLSSGLSLRKKEQIEFEAEVVSDD